jgi:hypothetical protein
MILIGCGGKGTGSLSSDEGSVVLPSGPTTGTARLVARVVFEGTPPVMPVIRVGGDPTCVAKHKDSPLLREDIVVNPDGTLRDTVVRIREGLGSYDWSSTRKGPLVINQDGCRFDPHVGTMMAGEAMEFRNADATIHNVNGLPLVNDKFNFSMINNKVPPRQVTFSRAEWPPVRIKCDVHPWMYAYVAVLDHPFHGATGTTGTVEIPALPAGEYVVEAWHRELGTKEQKVTIVEGATARLEFQYHVAAK